MQRLTKEQKVRRLKKCCEDMGMQLIGENMRTPRGNTIRFVYQSPANRTSGQLQIRDSFIDDSFSTAPEFEDKLDSLRDKIRTEYL